jgi:hypothetical protein
MDGKLAPPLCWRCSLEINNFPRVFSAEPFSRTAGQDPHFFAIPKPHPIIFGGATLDKRFIWLDHSP